MWCETISFYSSQYNQCLYGDHGAGFSPNANEIPWNGTTSKHDISEVDRLRAIVAMCTKQIRELTKKNFKLELKLKDADYKLARANAENVLIRRKYSKMAEAPRDIGANFQAGPVPKKPKIDQCSRSESIDLVSDGENSPMGPIGDVKSVVVAKQSVCSRDNQNKIKPSTAPEIIDLVADNDDDSVNTSTELISFECYLCKTRFFNDFQVRRHMHDTCFKAFPCNDPTAVRSEEPNFANFNETPRTIQPAERTATTQKTKRTPARIAVTQNAQRTQVQNSGQRLETDTEEKLYTCPKPNCRECFPSKTSFYFHLQEHSDGSNSDQCLICGKRFRIKSDLKHHIRWHAGEQPHVCKQFHCNRRFVSRSELRDHKKAMHKVQL